MMRQGRDGGVRDVFPSVIRGAALSGLLASCCSGGRGSGGGRSVLGGTADAGWRGALKASALTCCENVQ